MTINKALSFPFDTPPTPTGELLDVAPGVKWLRMPLPFGLDHINLYLLRDGDGWVILDTGLDTEDTRALWEQIFTMLPEKINAVICTHFHPDHAGLAGWLVARLRVPLYMTHGEYYTLRAMASPLDGTSWQAREFYQRAGFPPEQIDDTLKMLGRFGYTSPPPSAFRRLRSGEVLGIGEHDWQIIIGNGHSPEHACLFCPALGVLIAGDQLLPRITSNVIVNPSEPEADPLADWMDSLQRLGQLPADTLVLPAHEMPFVGAAIRARQMSEHHEKHLEDVMAHCQEQPRTGYDIMKFMFPRRTGAFDDVLALGEGLAHLAYLTARNRLERHLDADGNYRFSVPA